MLGNSKCKVLSLLDLKDAFHSLRLSENAKKYCSILPYFGIASYLYQRMAMGLNVSPPIWQTYIDTILNCLESKRYCEAIMDNLLLFSPSKQSHMRKLEDLLKALFKNGLKISPKKCQLFRKELQYMGNTIFIQEMRVWVRPLCSRLDAIQKLSFAHLLKREDFDAIVDHLALVHILKSKTEPVTTRIKRLSEVLSTYSFNLYYMIGKHMILSDFLSRQRVDRSDPHEVIPISFDMKGILKDKYYNVGKESRYLV